MIYHNMSFHKLVMVKQKRRRKQENILCTYTNFSSKSNFRTLTLKIQTFSQ